MILIAWADSSEKCKALSNLGEHRNISNHAEAVDERQQILCLAKSWVQNWSNTD